MGSRMRVCFICQLSYALFDPAAPQIYGGTELQMYLLSRELAKDPRFDVHFVLQDFGQPKRQMIEGVTVWRYTRPFKGSRIMTPLRWATVWVSTFLTIASTRASVYVESPAGFPAFHAALWRLLSGSRFVFRCASDGDGDGSIIFKPMERRLFLWGLRRADAIFARNRWQQEQLMELYGKPSTILPNAFPVPDAPPVAPKDTVLWVASSQNLKQPWLFLELARALPHESFTMVMPKNDVALWERIAQEVPDLPNLTFIEHVPLPEIQPYFDRAKLFVNTSTVEGFPNTFVQSAMGATPVLSLNVDPDEVLTANGFGICAHGDFERLSADLGELLGDDALRTEMGARAFEYAKRTHDIKSVIRLFEEVLREVSTGRVAR